MQSSPFVRALATIFITSLSVFGAVSSAQATLILSEDFDSSLPSGWAKKNNSGASDDSHPSPNTSWKTGVNNLFTANSGTGYATADFTSVTDTFGKFDTISNWMFTPEISLVNGTTISFYTRTTSIIPDNGVDDLIVRLSTNGSSVNVGSTVNSVGDFSTVLVHVNPGLAGAYPNGWQEYHATLSNIPLGATGRVAFHYYLPNGGNGLGATQSNVIGVDTLRINSAASVTPEASSILLLVGGFSGLLGMAFLRRRALQ